MQFFSSKPDWDVQVQRLIAEAEYSGADVFECGRTSARISARGGALEDWIDEWSGLGRKLLAEGEEALAAGGSTTVTAAKKLLRATNYLRTAELLSPYELSRRLPLYDDAQRAFRLALPYLPVETSVVEVRHDGATYEGYVCRGRGTSAAEPGPAVLFLGGADSYAEELYFFGGQALAERGITVMIVDTPGRGGTLRHQGIVSRPDYEVPAGRALDELLGLDSVDPIRVGLVGVSLGGYYAPRLAAKDDRVRALVCWCACFDVLTDLYEYFPPIQEQLQWITGSHDDAEAREKLKAFSLAEVASDITCPILISHGEHDDLMPASSAKRLYEHVSSDERVLRIWRSDEGGALHCNYDNWAACIPFMFDWLAQKLAPAAVVA
jgi:dipeptidyl aminopeptidase/acylaminoacyl peptidase